MRLRTLKRTERAGFILLGLFFLLAGSVGLWLEHSLWFAFPFFAGAALVTCGIWGAMPVPQIALRIFGFVDPKTDALFEACKGEFSVEPPDQSVVAFSIGGKKFARFRLGEDPHGSDADSELCSDCWANRGQFHAIGCDLEVCPACKSQALSCKCPIAELGRAEGDS